MTNWSEGQLKARQKFADYARSKEGKETSRKSITAYNKSDEHREYATQKCVEFNKTEVMKESSKKRLIALNKSDKARKRSSGFLTGYNKSEKGRATSRKNVKIMLQSPYFGSDKHRKVARKVGLKNIPRLLKYNTSEEGRENSRKVAIKNIRNLCKPTKSQVILSKALEEVGIKNELEWWVPECRRLIDIAILDKMVAIEVDGSVHERGCIHMTREQKQADDNLKDEQLKSLGWKVLRFKNKEVKENLSDLILKFKEEMI